jgi:hypothetical protein
MLTLSLILLFYITSNQNNLNLKTWEHQQLTHNILITKMHSSGSRPLCLLSKAKKTTNILLTVIMLAADIETNPAPNRNASTYPCGLCEKPSPGIAEGSVVMTAVFGTTNHASNFALTTMNFLKDPIYNGFAVSANQ